MVKNANSENSLIVSNGKITIILMLWKLDESLPVDIDSNEISLKTNVQNYKK
ncbi:hypothetical protein HYD71_00885 [Mycoplasmopsis bovis]|nr:hypothetical protein [Mycoplasmopsis bovis]QQH49465.1 hypothetical protein HYD71_00885 [Mycoplasmopsis bovis]